ncbi:MAG: DUF1631 family protein [Gammaproteobacteria bacterium]|jgi:hypothetical protein|nr:DUF1631 family protein [Gammaproteobacteria bacterium]MBT3725836.1 DUF1631 family protein [Gammaproteobacteria bacterium]MBT4077541.1 DUF1631 family protein [Gammaproteobacteria bacterium]MBT4195715.1 DUF1631 family protein [Gammaproteobacteria bacterium]MBT4450792.1 DUF1631 family protein [Gammaproteobacteria bacterium]
MIAALQQFPRFDKGSPSSEYQQIINFCVNYLEGMLVGLIHMEIPSDIEQHADIIKPLQQRLLSRERTVRHAFQFQIEKHFSDFKSISRSRLNVNYANHSLAGGLSDHKATQIREIIETISSKHQNNHKNQLQNTARRLKTLVHRSDDNYDDNPISPLKLSRAFLASIETLNLTAQKYRYLFQLFDHTLDQQLGNFYDQIDLGLYHLDILVELTDASLFLPPEEEETPPAPQPSSEVEAVDNSITEVLEPESQKSTVTSIQNHIDKIKGRQLEFEHNIEEFKLSTENGTVDFVNLFSKLKEKIKPLVDKKQLNDINKFAHFFTSLLNNSLLSTPLKTQLSRLSCPLLEMVLIDPFFFRSSSHPVNDFLQSIVDFELRFNHQGESLAILASSIDSLLQIEKPGLSDYQPLIDDYENFKTIEAIRLEKIKEEKLEQEEKLKDEMLQLINEVTKDLVVEQEVMQFFYDDWQLLLFHLAQKQGKTSSEFKNSVNIAKMLSWFLDENKKGSHPRFETTSFKSLLTSIEIGLVTLNYSSEHRHRVRKSLIKEYKQANEKQKVTFIPTPAQNSSVNKLRLAHGNNLALSDEYSELVKKLSMGDWVEINTSNNIKFTRAKLKWKAADYSLFIFIDQRGHKIKECALTELVQDFSNGNIKLLKKPSTRYNSYF